jgi:hypothetical protein
MEERKATARASASATAIALANAGSSLRSEWKDKKSVGTRRPSVWRAFVVFGG